jgi:ParB-like chromosome segregation protein Spo0J
METAYNIDPKDVKFDSKIASFNKTKSDESYSTLKREIASVGQETPILIRNGLCGDGVHRTKIAEELGVKVLAVDIDATMSDKEFIKRCNRDTFTGRNYSPSQLAIAAYKLTKEFGFSDTEAVESVGLPKGSRSIGYARYIDSSPLGKQLGILDILSAGNAVVIEGKATKSIDTAKRLIKKAEELEVYKEAIDALNGNQVVIDYNDVIGDSEVVREMFWDIYKLDDVSRNLKLISLIKAALEIKNKEEI